MRANRRRDTGPERQVRSLLHCAGLRFRVDFPINAGGRKVRPDIVFTARRLAVFVDGCFWHGCPEHGRIPKTNPAYWEPKIAGNQRRDEGQQRALEAAGWEVIRIWEHVAPENATQQIISAYRSLEP
ncbi:MAG: very short patch repair endonuclease [Solirubrobacterales bacterium]|nr:very short patch repair endonuclease [Solirubrobacterales bacterium]